MPIQADVQLHAGEIFPMNELMEPREVNNPVMEANSSITLSVVPFDVSANSAASANGPLAPMVHALPNLNLEVVPNGPV